MKQIILFSFFMMLVPGVALCMEEVPGEITELYVKSGLKKQIDSFPSIILAQIDAAIENDPDKSQYKENDVNRIKKLINDIFGAPDIKTKSIEVLSQGLKPDDTRNLLDWLESSVGKKVAWYEDHVSTPAGYLQMRDYEKSLGESLPTDDYRLAIEKLTANMKVMEAAIGMALNNQILVNSAVASLLPGFTIEMLDKIAKQAELNENSLVQQVSAYMDLTMLFTYSYLSEKEISEYLEFTSTPLGKRYFSITTKSLNTTFKKASIEFRSKLIQSE